jgi:hypothetical protein
MLELSLIFNVQTGISNDDVEPLQPFNNSLAIMIQCFVDRQKSPLCLVAHNGYQFDFPILRDDFRRTGVILPDDTLCMDTRRMQERFDEHLLETVFSLAAVYKRICGRSMQYQHNAEGDVMAMLEICRWQNAKVCRFADENAILFNSAVLRLAQSPLKSSPFLTPASSPHRPLAMSTSARSGFDTRKRIKVDPLPTESSYRKKNEVEEGPCVDLTSFSTTDCNEQRAYCSISMAPRVLFSKIDDFAAVTPHCEMFSNNGSAKPTTSSTDCCRQGVVSNDGDLFIATEVCVQQEQQCNEKEPRHVMHSAVANEKEPRHVVHSSVATVTTDGAALGSWPLGESLDDTELCACQVYDSQTGGNSCCAGCHGDVKCNCQSGSNNKEAAGNLDLQVDERKTGVDN